MGDHGYEGCSGEVENLFCPDNVGLLVVDIQEKLWPHMADKSICLKYMCNAVEVAGHLGLPIIVTEQYVKGLGRTVEEVTTALTRFDAYQPIEKRAFSCFGESTFVEALEENGIETLAIIGIEAHICVMQTALEAIDNGLDVFLLGEACSSRELRHKNEAITRVREAGAIVGSVEMFAFEAMRTAEHPAFKAVQRVIL